MPEMQGNIPRTPGEPEGFEADYSFETFRFAVFHLHDSWERSPPEANHPFLMDEEFGSRCGCSNHGRQSRATLRTMQQDEDFPLNKGEFSCEKY